MMTTRQLPITPQTAKKAIGTFYAPTSVLTHRTATPTGRKTIYQLGDDTFLHTGSGHHVFMASSGKPRDFNPRLFDRAARVSVFVKEGQRLLQNVQPREVTDYKITAALIDSLIHGGVTLFSPFHEVYSPELTWQDSGPEQSLDAAYQTLGIDAFKKIDRQKLLNCLKIIFNVDLTALEYSSHPKLDSLSGLYKLFRNLQAETYELLVDYHALAFYPLFAALDALEMTEASLKYEAIGSSEYSKHDRHSREYEQVKAQYDKRIYFTDTLDAYCTDPRRNQNDPIMDQIRKDISLEAFLESLYVGALIHSNDRGPEVQALRTIVEAYWKKEGKVPFQPQPKASLGIGSRIIGWLLKH